MMAARSECGAECRFISRRARAANEYCLCFWEGLWNLKKIIGGIVNLAA
jgi:hypothetical protein